MIPSLTMKNLVFMTCVLSALVVSVFSFRCYSYSTKNSTTCNKDKMEVVDCLGEKCVKACQYFYNGITVFESVFYGCAIDGLCETNGQSSGENLRYRFLATCCDTELCNDDECKLPKDDLTPNGLQCPTCYNSNSTEKCVSTKKMNCTGTEGECFEYRGSMKMPDESVQLYSVQGCSNNVTCNFNFDKHIKINELFRDELTCKKPHPKPGVPDV
ncbi:protein RoBo-1-like [Engystomops pustulosus]|uniref:protein RoBo-1-like n=1 Tax=Engystomops pustulosus TaxID=76066 RepID=UPI003AFAD384